MTRGAETIGLPYVIDAHPCPTITLGAQIEVSDNNFQFDLKDYDECAEVGEPV